MCTVSMTVNIWYYWGNLFQIMKSSMETICDCIVDNMAQNSPGFV